MPFYRAHGVSFSTTSPLRRLGLREATVRGLFAGRASHRPSLRPMLSARAIAILTNQPISTASSGTLALARFARLISHRKYVDLFHPRALVSILILAARYFTLSRSWQRASGRRSHLTAEPRRVADSSAKLSLDAPARSSPHLRFSPGDVASAQ